MTEVTIDTRYLNWSHGQKLAKIYALEARVAELEKVEAAYNEAVPFLAAHGWFPLPAPPTEDAGE